MEAPIEVAIIGAGLAGLAAARELVRHGIGVELFEASGRIGGRVETVSEGHALPVELGPEYVHGEPEVALALLREAGLATQPITDAHYMTTPAGLVPAGDVWARFAALLAHARGRDESAHAYREHMHMSRDDAALFTMLVEGYHASPLDDISIASVADEEPGAQARVRGGYEQLVGWLAAELVKARIPVRLGSFVHAIEWGGDPVRIAYRAGGGEGEAVARQVIVTVPIGVLHARALAFVPHLGAHVPAIECLGMGQVVKVVLCLREPVWRGAVPEDAEFVHGDEAFPTYWFRSSGDAHQLTAWAGGRRALLFAGCSPEQLVEGALAGFARAAAIPQSRIAAAMLHHHVRDFDGEPYTRGAYSYTRVGGGEAAAQLARPLGGRLWFAGEATDSDYQGSVAGALASGMRAARDLMQASATARAMHRERRRAGSPRRP